MAAGSRRFGIETVAVGTALGALGEAGVLAFGVRRLGFSLLPGFAFKLPANWFNRQYMPLLASGFVGGSRVAVDQAVAATLGPGGVSALNLGTRLISVVGGIVPSALGTVIMPRLSRVAARKGWEELRQYAIRVAAGSALCACLIAGVLAMLSRPIAYLLFQRGTSLHLDIALLAHIQTVSLSQLPFLFGVAILTRTALVRASGRMLMLMSIVSAAANLGFDILCARSMGITGVVFATTLVQIVSTALLLPALRRSDTP